MENIADGVYEVDLEGNYLYFNNSMSRILGHPPHEILFQNFSKFMTEDQAKVTFEMFHRADMTKFAKFQPTVDDADSDFKFANEFVDKTIPVMETPETKEENLEEVAK